MVRGRRTMKKRGAGRLGMPGLTIKTGAYAISTTLRRDEIDAMVAKLQDIQGRNIDAYAQVAQIAGELLARQGAITLEGDVSQVQHAKSFAEAAVSANNVKRAKYDKAENVANIIIGVLERIRSSGSMTGGDGFFEGLKGVLFGNNNKNKALTSASNVQMEEPDLEIPEPQPNMKEEIPFTSPNLKLNNIPIVNQPMVNDTYEEPSNNIQPMTGGKRRKSKTRKHKKSHKRR